MTCPPKPRGLADCDLGSAFADFDLSGIFGQPSLTELENMSLMGYELVSVEFTFED